MTFDELADRASDSGVAPAELDAALHTLLDNGLLQQRATDGLGVLIAHLPKDDGPFLARVEALRAVWDDGDEFTRRCGGINGAMVAVTLLEHTQPIEEPQEAPEDHGGPLERLLGAARSMAGF